MKYKNLTKVILGFLAFSSSTSCMIPTDLKLTEIEKDPKHPTSFLHLIPKGQRIHFLLKIINWENKTISPIPTNIALANILPSLMLNNHLTLIPKSPDLNNRWRYYNSRSLTSGIFKMIRQYTINGNSKYKDYVKDYLLKKPPCVNKNGPDLVNYLTWVQTPTQKILRSMSQSPWSPPLSQPDQWDFITRERQRFLGQVLLWHIIKYYIRDGYFNINYQDPKAGKTILMHEVFYGNINSVKFLVCLFPHSKENNLHIMNLKDNKNQHFLDYAKLGATRAGKLLTKALERRDKIIMCPPWEEQDMADMNKENELIKTYRTWMAACNQIINS